VMCAYDGRGPATNLGRHLLAFLNLEGMEDLGAWTYRQPHTWQQFAQLAAVVIQVAAGGDVVARDILRTAGQELGRAGVAVIQGLGLTDQTFPVVLAGGVLRARPPDLLQALEETILAVAPRADICFPQQDPAVGAGLLALEALAQNPRRSDVGSVLADPRALASEPCPERASRVHSRRRNRTGLKPQV